MPLFPFINVVTGSGYPSVAVEAGLMRTKPCAICGEDFPPSPRHFSQQKTCKKEACRKERHRLAQANWVKANPGCFKGRYPALKKSWDYKGYLRQHREENPEYVADDNRERKERHRRAARRADIQDTVARRRETIAAVRFRRGADIQDTVRLKLDGILDCMEGWCADMQDSMARGGGVGLR